MEDKLQDLIKYLEDSLVLSTPLIENDPSYQQIKDNIPSIIEMSLMSMGKSVDDELTPKEKYLVVLKSLYVLYMRLATASAPEFDVSAEQVSFKKGDRFFHYTSLAEKAQADIEKAEQSDIECADITISTRNGTIRNYNLSKGQKVNLQVGTVSSTSAELSWNMFNLGYGEFCKYALMYSTKSIYDEYSVPILRQGNDVDTISFWDIKRTKYRLMNLSPNTTYYIVMVFYNRDGHKSIEQVELMTGDAENG